MPQIGTIMKAGLMLGLSCLAQPVLAGIEVNAGLVCQTESQSSSPAPDTVSGYVRGLTSPERLEVIGRKVPARLGLSFGVEMRLDAFETTTPGRMVVRHPPMGPEGTVRQSWALTLHPEDWSIVLYTFDYEFELLPGVWSYEFVSDEGALFRRDFLVVDPGDPGAVDPCQVMPLS